MPAYKDEQRKTWYCSFYYTDFQGNKKLKKKRGFKLKREAEEWERKFLENYTQSSDITFETLFSHYMEDCKSRLKPTTYAQKKYLVESQILPYFKNFKVDEITPLIVRKWQNNLISAGYKPTYLRGLHRALSSVFNYGVNYFGLKENPCRKAGNIGKQHADKIDFWTVEEFAQFTNALLADGKYPIYVMSMLLFWTGMRNGELLALYPADIDFENNTITISKTYKRLNGEDIIQTPKTVKSNRTIAIPPQLTNLVKEYMHKAQVKPEQRIFEYANYALGQQFTTVCKKHGLKKIRVHDLRHSHASYLINKGFSPLVIKERLGHDNINTTLQTYSHLYPSTTEDIINTIAKELMPN